MSSNPADVIDIYDVKSFCKANNFSRTFFYKLLKEGRGPKTIKIGHRTMITREAAETWRARLDADGGI